MFDRLKRLYRKISEGLDGDGDTRDDFDVDRPRPQRANPDPPRDDWFARVRERSFRAHAAAETKVLDRADEREPRLSREASRDVDELLAKVGRPSP